jgi:pilus assembly protein FimV
MSAGRFVLNRVAVAAAVSVLSALPASAWALGLGKLNVQSALGEGLRAEIDVTSLSPEEGATLQVKVASPETYRAAGVDYNGVLANTAITLQRRADGRPFLRLSSDRPVQEPFVDVILDLAWSSGRLVREYTLLFDPPAARTAQAPINAPLMEAPAPAPVPVPASVTPRAVPQAAAPVPSPSPAPAPVADSKPRKAPAKSVSGSQPDAAASTASTPAPAVARQPAIPPAAAPASAPAPQAEATRTVKVRSGDSLSAIAQRNAVEGVSLDQMLVGLYRSNPQAFQGNNMNRLKAGVVLNMPSAEEAKQVPAAEARQVIVAQSADFAAYRQRLAGTVAPSPVEQPERQASGKVEAEVKDRKQAAAPAPDKLTLSKGGLSAGAAAEDRVAKARAKEESTARVAELSKNLEELRKLREKAAQASAPGKASPAPAPAPAPVAAPAPVPAPAPVKAAASAPPAPAPVPSIAEVASAPAEVVASVASAAQLGATIVADAASEVASAASAAVVPAVPAPVSVPTPPPAPAPEEPGFLESINLMAVAAGGAAVALLAGGLMFLRSRRRADTGETSFLESRLQPDSFFGASGGQRVDTRDATGGPSSMSYSLSQLDAIGDVDPVAEADVYLAYGRDLQAEEILKEALRSTPERLAIRTKLLEVYAKRRDTKGFEQLAVQLHALTQGQGEDWARTQELGLGIDPENPLYQPGGQPAEAPLSVEQPADALGASTIPHSVMPAPSMLDSVAPPVPESLTASDAVDLDLDISSPAPLDEVKDSVSPPVTAAGDLPPLELPEFGEQLSQASRAAPSPSEAPLEFGVDLPSLDVASPAPAAQVSAVADGLDFGIEAPAVAAPAPASFDLSDISLDLDAPAAEPPAAQGADQADLTADPMSRKLELAEEFRQIGDADGARELLQEVIDLAQDAGLKARAQSMLDSLS